MSDSYPNGLTEITTPAANDFVLGWDSDRTGNRSGWIALSRLGVLSLAQSWTALQTFSAGISFGGATLNAYETGTWSPGLTFGGNSVGMSLTVGGSYTKIGRMVYLTGGMTVTTKGSSTGNAVVTGLPFARTGGGTMLVRWANLATVWSNIAPIASGTTILLRGATTAAASNNTNMTHADIQNGTVIEFEGCYITA